MPSSRSMAPPVPPLAPAANRRVAPRIACSLSARYQTVGFHTDASRPAVGRDLSLRGIALVTKNPIRPGTCLRLYLSSADGDAGIARAVVVRHYTQGGGGRWIIGCSFAPELTAEELTELLT